MLEYELVKSPKQSQSNKGMHYDPKPVSTSYDDLVNAKSPLVEGLSEDEFYATHDYSQDLGSWIREPKGKDTLTSYIAQAEDRRNLQLFLQKVSTGEFDDEGKDDERPLTPEEWKEFQRMAMEDMEHIQYPQIPYEDIPEPNRPEIPNAFQDAFDDDDDSPVKKLYKAYVLNKENGDDENDLRNPYEEHKFDQWNYEQTGKTGKPMDRLEAVQAGLCAKCGGKSGDYKTGEGFTDEVSRREYGITGYCQQCQDDFYGSLPPDEPMEKFYKAYVLNKRINIKDQQRGAPGLGIHPQDIAARRASAKRLQQEKFRSNKDANINMDFARDMQSGNFQTRDSKDTSKVIPQTRAFPKESYIPRSKKFGEKLIETENQHIRSSRDQGPDVMIADPNFKPKPTDTMSKPSLSSQAWRHRDMQNRPEDRGAFARDQKNTSPNEKGRHMKWQSTSDLVNRAMGRPKGTPTVQQGKMNIAPTGYKPQTQTPLKGAQWKGTANKKAAASTYTPGIKSASQLET